MTFSKKAFTMTELIVAITIVVILSAIGFTSYSNYVSNARDTKRKSDFANIESALNGYKQEKLIYPEPGNIFKINYGSNTVAKQGFLDKNVRLYTLKELLSDPRDENINYTYSVTWNNLEYQIAGTLENNDKSIALVKGDYKSIVPNILPTIVLASRDSDINIQSKKDLFVFDKNGDNLVYNWDGYPKAGGINISTKLDDIWLNSAFNSCDEIKEAGKILYNGETGISYKIANNDGTLSEKVCN